MLNNSIDKALYVEYKKVFIEENVAVVLCSRVLSENECGRHRVAQFYFIKKNNQNIDQQNMININTVQRTGDCNYLRLLYSNTVQLLYYCIEI